MDEDLRRNLASFVAFSATVKTTDTAHGVIVDEKGAARSLSPVDLVREAETATDGAVDGLCRRVRAMRVGGDDICGEVVSRAPDAAAAAGDGDGGGGGEHNDRAGVAAQVAQFKGVQRLRRLRERLSTILQTRSDDQKRFHEEMLLMSLPTIFKEDWSKNSAAILHELALEFDFDIMGIIISTPRRFGKTTAVAAFVGAMMLECTDVSVVVFAVGQRAAHMLAEKVWLLIQKHVPRTTTDGKKVVETCNKEIIALRMWGGLNKMHCVPSNPTGARGTGGDVIILEEFGFMDDDFFRNIVIPLLAVRGSRVIAISSPSDKAVNHMQTAMDATDASTGKKLFKSIRVTRVCDKCAAEQNMDCQHIVPTNPPWRTATDEDRLMSLYKGSEREGLRELMGATVSSDTTAFATHDIDALFGPPGRLFTCTLRQRPQRIYIAFDPSAGGHGSDSAWVSFFFPTVHNYCANSLVVSSVFIASRPRATTAPPLQRPSRPATSRAPRTPRHRQAPCS